MNDKATLVVIELRSIAEDFSDEIKRKPSSVELCEILAWGLRSCRDYVLADVHPANVTKITPKLKKGAKRHATWVEPQGENSAVDDLNDQVFVAASGLLTDMSRAIAADDGATPTLDTLCRALVQGLHLCPDDLLADVRPVDIDSVKATVQKKGRIVTKLGDIVAIPAKNGDHLLAVVLTKNYIGTAYGFFEGTSNIRRISIDSHPPPRPYPVYTSDHLVSSGKWKIIGHDETLLKLFPAEPEIYHADQLWEGGYPVGPYGSAETPSGKWRDLTKKEAEEIGLLSGTYSQVCPPDLIEECLTVQLPGDQIQ